MIYQILFSLHYLRKCQVCVYFLLVLWRHRHVQAMLVTLKLQRFIRQFLIGFLCKHLHWWSIGGKLVLKEVSAMSIWTCKLKRFTKCKKQNPITGLNRAWGFQEVEAPSFHDNRHMKFVRLSALCTDRLYPPGYIPGTHFCYRLSQSQDHSATGRIMSMKNSSDIIGNRTRDISACGVVPQTNAPPRTHFSQTVVV